MNLLAHFYLSHVHLPTSSEEVLVGNFIGDFVRGNQFEGFTPDVVRGIRLHRAIDSFTDAHPAVRRSTERLRAGLLKMNETTPDAARTLVRYASVMVDVLYDHVLAVEWEKFSSTNLPLFAEETYRICLRHREQMPAPVAALLPSMIEHNWLVNYGTRYGMERSLMSLSRRARYASGFEQAADVLAAEMEGFRSDFLVFFPEAIAASHDALALYIQM
jgi:acyl carrier protein phosphodiesterase